MLGRTQPNDSHRPTSHCVCLMRWICINSPDVSVKKQTPWDLILHASDSVSQGTKFDLVSIRFNYSRKMTLEKHIDKSIMNWCLVERWCLQCGHNFSCQGISDLTQICPSAAADGGLLETWKQTGKQTERENIYGLLHIIIHPVPVTHLHKSKKAIHHPRAECMAVKDCQKS